MYGTYCRLNVSVWDSNLAVLRALHKKLKPFTQDRRSARKQIFRAILREHRDERKLAKDFNL